MPSPDEDPDPAIGQPSDAAAPGGGSPTPPRKETSAEHSLLLEHPIAVGFAILLLIGLGRVLTAAAGVALLGFLAVLLATLLEFPLDFFSRFMPRAIALIVTIALLAGVGAVLVLLAVPVLTEQAGRFAQQLPIALHKLEVWWAHVQRTGPIPGLPDVPNIGSESMPLLGKAVLLAVNAVTLTGTVFAVFVLAFFLAYSPASYRDGIRAMIAREHQPLFDEVWGRLGTTLRHWTAGILGAMVMMGVLTALGLYLAGISGWFLLGILTFLGTFVPYVGALASAVPGLMVGLAESPTRFLYAGIVYVCVHLVEGYLVEPFIMGRAVRLRPALLLFWQIFMGAILGLPGILVATPLLACLDVAVGALYIERRLGMPPPPSRP